MISVLRLTTVEEGAQEAEDFNIRIAVGRSYWKIVIFSIFFAAAFAVPHIITAFRFPEVANQTIIWALIGGLVAAAATIFKDGLKLK